MAVLIITVLVIIILVAVLYPLLASSSSATTDELAYEAAQRLRRARDRVYEEIRVLQQEYFLQHLSEEEYRSRLEAARVQAALLLRQQERVQQTLAQLGEAAEADIHRAGSGETAKLDEERSAG